MDEILQHYEVRKSNKEKTRFIAYMKNRLGNRGYHVSVEEKGKGLFWSRNIIVGNPKEASVVFDTIATAKARDTDVIICDTAGRLHNKKNLMDELAKIFRIVKRELPDADMEALLVLDATTGQNAVNQAKEFGNVTEISGIVLTKLDGTARGGVVVTIQDELNIPVKFIGVGEQIDDLQPFVPEDFANALFETGV